MSAGTRVLVTGAGGFVGRALVPVLVARGCSVISHGRSSAAPREIVDTIAAEQPDVVVHLATRFIAGHEVDDIPDLVRSNIEFGLLVAEGAVAAGARMIVIGSAWQHYEGRAYDPTSLYAATKQAFEVVLDYYRSVRGLETRTVTLFDTYGPGDLRPKLIPLLMRAALDGTPMDMSDGENLIDLTYISDVVNGIADVALDRDAPPDCVLRTWQPITVREVVSHAERAFGREVPVRWGVREARPREMRTDWVFGAPPPGWAPTVSLSDGLSRTWDDFVRSASR